MSRYCPSVHLQPKEEEQKTQVSGIVIHIVSIQPFCPIHLTGKNQSLYFVSKLIADVAVFIRRFYYPEENRFYNYRNMSA